MTAASPVVMTTRPVVLMNLLRLGGLIWVGGKIYEKIERWEMIRRRSSA
jgi:hypothetical protein